MKRRVEKCIALLLLFTFIAGSVTSFALAQTPIRKLGRGVANIATGIFELPMNIVETAEEEGYIASVTYGIAKGLAMSVLRIGVGAYETVTFLIPLPLNYEPVLEPEFLLSEDNL